MSSELGQNSILYSPQNVDSFNQALNSLISSPIRRTKMGEQAQKDVAEYNWNQAVENLIVTWTEQIDLKNNHQKRTLIETNQHP